MAFAISQSEEGGGDYSPPFIMDIFGLLILFVFLISGIFAWRSDIKQWNNGICPQTGKPWEYFDTDSQGGRGYKSGDHYIWISWPNVDK